MGLVEVLFMAGSDECDGAGAVRRDYPEIVIGTKQSHHRHRIDRPWENQLDTDCYSPRISTHVDEWQ